MSVVYKLDELKKAIKDNEYEIIIKGSLANKIKKVKKIATIGPVGIAALITLNATIGTATITAPVTGGTSLFLIAPVAAPTVALTGLEIATIILAISLGVGLIIAIFKDYEEVEYSKGSLILRKKRKKK